jgi:hypothetical protein
LAWTCKIIATGVAHAFHHCNWVGLQQEEQKLSRLRMEASKQGFGSTILCGIGSAGMGQKSLELMVGCVPLATCMKLFISMYSAAMEPAFLQTCIMQQRKWEEQESNLRGLRHVLIASAQSPSTNPNMIYDSPRNQ